MAAGANVQGQHSDATTCTGLRGEGRPLYIMFAHCSQNQAWSHRVGFGTAGGHLRHEQGVFQIFVRRDLSGFVAVLARHTAEARCENHFRVPPLHCGLCCFCLLLQPVQVNTRLTRCVKTFVVFCIQSFRAVRWPRKWAHRGRGVQH